MQLHCNKCFQNNHVVVRGGNASVNKFYISRLCKHILCHRCSKPKCPVCKCVYKPIIIDTVMPGRMHLLFENCEKQYQIARQVFKFQMTQASYHDHYYVKVMPQIIEKTRKESEALVRVGSQIVTTLTSERERIEKLNRYLYYHERHVTAKSLSQKTNSSGRGRLISSQSRRVSTPSLSIPDSDSESNGDVSTFMDTKANDFQF